MAPTQAPTWSFLTNHARVLLCIAQDPTIRLREIGERVGITERAAHRIVVELVDAGYVSRARTGRRNRYTIHGNLPLHDRIVQTHRLEELLDLLTKHHRGGSDGLQRHPGPDKHLPLQPATESSTVAAISLRAQ